MSRTENTEQRTQRLEKERTRFRSMRGAEAAVRRLTDQRTAARGMTLQSAAPLVFQGMCRKENIRVYYTERPQTDGRTIWLGPINLMSELAPVYVYGHGCHERHHVVYSDFKAFENLESEGVRALANVLEDIRVDLLGSEDYAGYLLWREALICALIGSKAAPWCKPEELTAPALLQFTILLKLEAEVLGIEVLESHARVIQDRAYRDFGKAAVDAVLGHIGDAMPLESSVHCVQVAREILALLGDYAQDATVHLKDVAREAFPMLLPKPRENRAPQGSLFNASGEAEPEALPFVMKPGLGDAKRKAESFAALNQPTQWTNQDGMEVMRYFMSSSEYLNDDECFGDNSPGYVPETKYGQSWNNRRDLMREKFRECWEQSGSLRRLFQNALDHPCPLPERLSNRGLDVEDRALALFACGEDRLFKRPIEMKGRDIAVQILVDTSGSMEADDITFAKVTALRLMEAMRASKGIKASLSLFPGATSKSVTPVAKWDDNLRDAFPRIDFVEGFGATPILQALFTAAVELDERPEAAKAIFVITDGWFKEETLGDMLRALENRGIAVAMAGIGLHSTPCGKFHVRVDRIKDLPKEAGKLLAQVTKWLRTGH